MKAMRFSLLFLCSILILSACGAANTPSSNDKNPVSETLDVYTTVYPLQYFSERIGGDFVSVHSIYPPGSDEHTFDPTQKDMMAIADADLFFYIGLGLEGFVDNAAKTLKNEHVKMVSTADRIPSSQLMEGHEEHEHDHSHDDGHDHDAHGSEIDPHVWISPKLSLELAASITDALKEVKPEAASAFEKNFEELKTDLLQLDKQFELMAKEAVQHTFFVSHAAFGYLANDYGLTQTAIAGLNSQSEPSQKELAHLVEEAKEKKIRYILFEQNVSSKVAKVIQKEIGADSLLLHNLGVLSAEDDSNGETYFTLMEQNAETLRTALSGS